MATIFIRVMWRIASRDGNSATTRKIARGPRCTNFPPRAPNLSICPNDFSLNDIRDFYRRIHIHINRMNLLPFLQKEYDQ